MRKPAFTLAGELTQLRYESDCLAANPLNDPALRDIPVYLPPSYASSRKRYPVLYDLAAYTNSGPGRVGWKNFGPSIPERLDQMMVQGEMRECIVVFPDCFTRLGGNQFINSAAIGNYADYLIHEIVPFIDAQLRTKAEAAHRACYGKSSGGYGALIHGMRYSKHWGAIASHSPDCNFDVLYRTEWPAVLTHLQRFCPRPSACLTPQVHPGKDDGRIKRFLAHCDQTEHPSGMDITTLMMVCMAASYDPIDHPKPTSKTASQPSLKTSSKTGRPTKSNAVPEINFHLPLDLNTAEFIPERWKEWRKHDPLHVAKSHAKQLKNLRGVFLDCGRFDQYHIHFGTRKLHAELKSQGVKHKYAEFDGTHSGIDYRLNVSLPFLARRIS